MNIVHAMKNELLIKTNVQTKDLEVKFYFSNTSLEIETQPEKEGGKNMTQISLRINMMNSVLSRQNWRYKMSRKLGST